MPTLNPLPQLRVLLVYLHAQAGGDYFSDEPFAWSAGELRALGVAAELVHVHFDRTRPHTAAALEQRLLAHVAAVKDTLVVLDQCWLPELMADMQAQGALLCATDAFAVQASRPQFTLQHFAQNRLPLLDLVAALRNGEELLAVPNLVVDLGDGPLTSQRQQPWPPAPIALRPYCPVTDALVLGEPRDLNSALPPVRKSLDINSGCPFSAPIASNPLLTGVPAAGDEITRAGCSFCFMGGDYRALPVAQTVALTVAHAAWLQQQLPRLDEIVLRDQAALRYLPALARGLVAAGLQPLGLLVPGRGDAILRYGAEMAEAAAVLAGSGHWFAIHLIGFESFSQAQLDLYNKGVTVAEYAAALQNMRALQRQHPTTFRLDKGGASSFILFNPWTTLDDLRQNAEFCNEHSVLELANGLHLTRLRLYPNLPLYWKARQDGLLIDAAPSAFGAAFTGYAAEATWRFADARVALVETLLRQLAVHCQLPETVGLLHSVVRWVAGRLPRSIGRDELPLAEVLPDVVAEWRSLRALWQQPAAAEVAEAGPQRRENQQRTVLVGHACNNRCATCVGHRGAHPDAVAQLQGPVHAAAAAHGRVVLAGREPFLVPQVLELARIAQTAGARQVEFVTNGRVLAAPGAAERVARQGVTDLAIKRHRLADADEDAFAQVVGAGAQMRTAVAHVRAVPGLRWKLLLVPVRGGESELAALVADAAAAGAHSVQVQVLAAEVDLSQLPRLRSQLQAAREVAVHSGLRWAVSGF